MTKQALEAKVEKQLAEWEPSGIQINDGYVDFKAFGKLDMWAKLTPQRTGVKKNSARVDRS